MKRAMSILLGSAMFMIVTAGAATDKNVNAFITGIWRGEFENLPAVTLNITDEAGPLQGAVLFYLIRRNQGQAPTSSPGIPEPMFDPQFDGKRLTFKMSHRHAHSDTKSDPPVTFHLDLTGPNEARLIRVPEDGPAYIKMVREK